MAPAPTSAEGPARARVVAVAHICIWAQRIRARFTGFHKHARREPSARQIVAARPAPEPAVAVAAYNRCKSRAKQPVHFPRESAACGPTRPRAPAAEVVGRIRREFGVNPA